MSSPRIGIGTVATLLLAAISTAVGATWLLHSEISQVQVSVSEVRQDVQYLATKQELAQLEGRIRSLEDARAQAGTAKAGPQ